MLRCDQAQTFRAKKDSTLHKIQQHQTLFCGFNDHRSIRVVEHLIQTLKRRLGVMRKKQ